MSLERWRRYPRGRQVLMIANEMNRASKLLAPDDHSLLLGCYERVLALTDLTIADSPRPAVRREMLRWRDLVAEQYVAPRADPRAHAAIFRALLQLHPEAWQQLPYVTGAATLP
jgi:hypothetical protein